VKGITLPRYRDIEQNEKGNQGKESREPEYGLLEAKQGGSRIPSSLSCHENMTLRILEGCSYSGKVTCFSDQTESRYEIKNL